MEKDQVEDTLDELCIGLEGTLECLLEAKAAFLAEDHQAMMEALQAALSDFFGYEEKMHNALTYAEQEDELKKRATETVIQA